MRRIAADHDAESPVFRPSSPVIMIQTEYPIPNNETFNVFVNKEMARWNVPGLTVAVVNRAGLVFAGGYGLRDAEGHLPASPRTVFAIGSCTKAFTSFGLGLLVDERKLTWDTPVRDVLPEFRLQDEFASDHATIRDILSHRTGLPRHDLAWFKSADTRKEILARLAHLQPTREFRAEYQYQNIMFMVAGLIIERITGQSWEDFTQTRILNPLGMSQSFLNTADVLRQAEAALPYQVIREQLTRIPFYADGETALGPAGHIQSNVLDMARWLTLQLNDGAMGGADGQRLIQPNTLKETRKPHMPVNDPKVWAYGYEEMGHASYGLGWRLNTYRGKWLAQHSGAIDGFGAHASFMPNAGWGIVALGNNNSTNLPSIVAYNLYDRLLGLDEIPWSERFFQKFMAEKAQEQAEKDALAAGKKPGTRPSHPLAAYAGRYTNAGYGDVTLELRDDGLYMLYNTLGWSLAHHHFDTFTAYNQLFDDTRLVTFSAGPDGAISQAAIKLEPNMAEIEFAKF